MGSKRQVGVLGLGRFGCAAARELTRMGHEVLAIDSSERIVQAVADEFAHVARADMTDAEALQELGLGQFDAVIIGVSENLEASILTTVLLKQLGVRRVVAKARDELHGSILERIGADLVVYPEREMGHQVARSLAAPGVRDYLDAGPGFGFARVTVSAAMVDRTLAELDLEQSYGVALVAVCRGSGVLLRPGGSERLRAGDDLIVGASDENLERLQAAATLASNASPTRSGGVPVVG